MKARQREAGCLDVVGVGINGPGQTTAEAVVAIRQADIVYYAIPAPITELWVQQLNRNSKSLSTLYEAGKNRDQTYREMVRLLVDAVRQGQRVCAAFYGHPGVYVTATHAAVAQLRRAGFRARMFPGISADACLFADLGINPGDVGMQSFEATDFVVHRRRFDPSSYLLLWQVGILAEPAPRSGAHARHEHLSVLKELLSRYYPESHRVTIYCASVFPTHPPKVRRVRLADFDRCRIPPIALVLVTPVTARPSTSATPHSRRVARSVHSRMADGRRRTA